MVVFNHFFLEAKSPKFAAKYLLDCKQLTGFRTRDLFFPEFLLAMKSCFVSARERENVDRLSFSRQLSGFVSLVRAMYVVIPDLCLYVDFL